MKTHTEAIHAIKAHIDGHKGSITRLEIERNNLIEQMQRVDGNIQRLHHSIDRLGVSLKTLTDVNGETEC